MQFSQTAFLHFYSMNSQDNCRSGKIICHSITCIFLARSRSYNSHSKKKKKFLNKKNFYLHFAGLDTTITKLFVKKLFIFFVFSLTVSSMCQKRYFRYYFVDKGMWNLRNQRSSNNFSFLPKEKRKCLGNKQKNTFFKTYICDT